MREIFYSIEHMPKCFDPERFGGPVYFNGTGGGETLLWDNIVNFTDGMLSHGHVVSYNTSMIATNALKKLCNLPRESRLNLLRYASFHYIELKKRNLLNTFYNNLRMFGSAKISYSES